jgi:hypothetical protein
VVIFLQFITIKLLKALADAESLRYLILAARGGVTRSTGDLAVSLAPLRDNDMFTQHMGNLFSLISARLLLFSSASLRIVSRPVKVPSWRD